jgi:hypothetical protein
MKKKLWLRFLWDLAFWLFLLVNACRHTHWSISLLLIVLALRGLLDDATKRANEACEKELDTKLSALEARLKAQR